MGDLGERGQEERARDRRPRSVGSRVSPPDLNPESAREWLRLRCVYSAGLRCRHCALCVKE